MTVKNVVYRDFRGINNLLPEYALGQEWLQTAQNVDLDDDADLRRRRGYARQYVGDTHSLWSNGAICLFRNGTNLRRLWTDYTTTVIKTGLSSSKIRMGYVSNGSRIYFSDGQDNGIIESGAARSWGLAIPQISSILTLLTPTDTGGLLTGKYQVCFTFLRNDGQESGASNVLTFTVASDGQGVTIPIPQSSDSGVVATVVYMTHADGEVFYRLGEFEVGTTTTNYIGSTKEFNIRLETKGMHPAPVGYPIAIYNGRAFVVDGSVVWYSIANGLELFRLASDYLYFDDPVTMFVPVNDGIWAATDKKIIFLQGQEPPFNYIEKADYGSPKTEGAMIPGQYFRMDGKILTWLSHKGYCIGGNQGEFVNLTEDRHIPNSNMQDVQLLFRQEEGVTQLVSIASW